jgi:hypothetical protein
MKLSFVSLPLLVLAISLASCATYPDVHKMDDGNNYISFLVARKGDGNRDGMKQAEAFCSKVNRNHAVVVTETFNYVGSVGEEEYSDVKAEAELKKPNRLTPKIPKKEKDVNKPGSAVMVGGEGEKEIQSAKGYEYTLVFRCS